MTAIEVAKLRLNCPVEQRDHVRFAIEDGLRTSIPDDRRLVLLRTMQIRADIGTLQPALRQKAVRSGWIAAISSARHGGDDGAADANCVWFASREEAETLLLSRLLAGRSVEAWYWKLALPYWRERPVNNWVSDIFSAAVARQESHRVMALASCFIATGTVDRLVEILAGPPGTIGGPMPAFGRGAWSFARSDPSHSAERAEVAAHAFAESIARDVRAMVVALVKRGGEARTVAAAIMRAWLLKRSPALALSENLLTSLVWAVIEAMGSSPVVRRRSVAANARASRSHRHVKVSGSAEPVSTSRASPFPELQARQPAIESAGKEPDAPVASIFDSTSPDIPPLASARLRSTHAGLWLVVPSLVELGFREWLAGRPALLGDNPGGCLLHEIARHHRVAPDDPALFALEPLDDPETQLEWCRLWRHGLDRWLRRSVGRRLHDLVNRPGELDCSDRALVIHYPAVHADLALRWRALDRDPGWTDWLGLSIRYNFGGTEDWL